MTESEWLQCENPQQMLRYLTHETPERFTSVAGSSERPRKNPLISPRKPRLFACACARQVWTHLTDPRSRTAVEVAEWYADGGSGDTRNCPWFPDAVMTDLGYLQIAHREADKCVTTVSIYEDMATFAADPNIAESARMLLTISEDVERHEVAESLQAALLREICGNPFRPVELPGWRTRETDGTVTRNDCPWLTPQVISLAEAAYENRPGRKCERCGGSGVVGKQVNKLVRDVDVLCPDCHGTGHRQGRKCETCRGTGDETGDGQGQCGACRGSGRIEDGALCPTRLAILADALQEAGCDNPDILNHLRGKERCLYCVMPETCSRCQATGWMSKRSPCVRGCAIIDILLGKE